LGVARGILPDNPYNKNGEMQILHPSKEKKAGLKTKGCSGRMIY
jgi:hypothetical protein